MRNVYQAVLRQDCKITHNTFKMTGTKIISMKNIPITETKWHILQLKSTTYAGER